MIEAVNILEEKGFKAIATDLPGEWSTDGEWTIAVQTRPVHGGPLGDNCHHVLVYGVPPGNINIRTEYAAQTTAMSSESAIRRALDEAGYPVNDGH